MGEWRLSQCQYRGIVKGAPRSSLAAELIVRAGRVKGESPSGVSTEKIVLVAMVFSYDVIVRDVNIESRVEYNSQNVLFVMLKE